MDATNRQIIAQLAEIGRQYFESLEVEPGTYTAAELAANYRTGDKAKRPIYKLPDRDAKPTGEADELAALYAWEPLTVAAGSFVCEIPRALVFHYLWKFEQLDKVAQKEKTRYTREKEGGASFFVTIPKEAAQLTKFVGVDEYRPNVMQIYLDVERGALVATDTHILAEYPAEIEGAEILDETTPAIFINPKHLKNLIGRCRVQLVEETEEAETCRDGVRKHFTAVFTNEAGDVYKNELTGLLFPDYRRVYPKVSTAGYIQFTPGAVKEFTKFAKAINKLSGDVVLRLSAEEGETSARLAYSGPEWGDAREVVLSLAYPAPLSFCVGFGAPQCADALGDWNGGAWFNDPSRPLIVDSNAARLVMIMPRCIDNPRGAAVGELCAALDRANNLPEGITPPKVKAAPKRKKTAAPVKVEAPAPVVDVIEEKKATDAEIIAFVDWLAEILDAVVKSFYRAELARAVDRVRELAQLAGVDILDVLADAVPMPAEVETAQNSTPEAAPPQASPVVILDVVEEPRTIPAMFRASPPAIVRPSVVLAAVEYSGPPGHAFSRSMIVCRRPRRRGSRAIRGDTANIFPNKSVNFVIQKYFNTS